MNNRLNSAFKIIAFCLTISICGCATPPDRTFHVRNTEGVRIEKAVVLLGDKTLDLLFIKVPHYEYIRETDGNGSVEVAIPKGPVYVFVCAEGYFPYCSSFTEGEAFTLIPFASADSEDFKKLITSGEIQISDFAVASRIFYFQWEKVQDKTAGLLGLPNHEEYLECLEWLEAAGYFADETYRSEEMLEALIGAPTAHLSNQRLADPSDL